MSAPLYIPSSSITAKPASPTSVSVKTASYTIPVGRYARVIVNLEGSATFTINSVTALRGTQYSILSSSPLNTANVGGSGPIGLASTTSPSINQLAFNSATAQETVVQDIWCPTGTVISGTSTWRAIVEEYTI